MRYALIIDKACQRAEKVDVRDERALIELAASIEWQELRQACRQAPGLGHDLSQPILQNLATHNALLASLLYNDARFRDVLLSSNAPAQTQGISSVAANNFDGLRVERLQRLGIIDAACRSASDVDAYNDTALIELAETDDWVKVRKLEKRALMIGETIEPDLIQAIGKQANPVLGMRLAVDEGLRTFMIHGVQIPADPKASEGQTSKIKRKQAAPSHATSNRSASSGSRRSEK